MPDLYNIEDHMALSCGCGCVRFNLLKSGAIECDSCQQKQTNLMWSEEMNPNQQPTKESKPTIFEVGAGKEVIRAAIENNQQCFWPEIVKQNDGKLPIDALLQASREMRKDNEIRLREDAHEHAMEYLLR